MMRGNKAEIMFVLCNGKYEYFSYELDNELDVELTYDEDLLRKAKNSRELSKCVGKMFINIDYTDCDDFILEVLDDFDFEDCSTENIKKEYKTFINKLSTTPYDEIYSIIFMANKQYDNGDREYEWLCFDVIDKKTRNGKREVSAIRAGSYGYNFKFEPESEKFMRDLVKVDARRIKKTRDLNNIKLTKAVPAEELYPHYKSIKDKKFLS
jgi:hypothetical protein